MNIAALDAFALADDTDAGWMLLRASDDDGFTGWGECAVGRIDDGWTERVAQLGRSIKGNDPQRTSATVAQLRAAGDGSAIDRTIVAAVEIALHDLVGRSLGVPAYDLLGGLYREHIPVSRSMRSDSASPGSPLDPDALTAALGLGFRTLTIVLAGAEDATDDRQQIDAIVGRVAAVREHVGRDIGLIVDAGRQEHVDAVVRLAQGLESLHVSWLEISGLKAASMRAALRRTRLRLCHGRGLGRPQLLPALEAHATDIVVVDAGLDGLDEARRRSELAGHFDAMSSTSGAIGPIGLLADVQLVAAAPAYEIMGVDGRAWDAMADVLDVPLTLELGKVRVPDGPGLGADVREDALRRLS